MTTIVDEISPKAVIDAGPLFTILVLNYARKPDMPAVKRNKILQEAKEDLVRRPECQEGYLELFTSIRTVVTTSHVIGELQGLWKSRVNRKGDDLRLFWQRSMEFFMEKNLNEELLRLLDLQGREESCEAVCALGPADAGLIDLAQRERCSVVTDDWDLAQRLRSKNVDCFLTQERGL